MQIQVKLGEPLWRAVGRRRLALDWPDGTKVTVTDVLARLASEHPDFAAAYAGQGLVQVYPYRVFVDGVLVPLPRPAATGPARPGAPGAGHRQRAAASAEAAAPEGSAEASLHAGQTVFILLPAAGG